MLACVQVVEVTPDLQQLHLDLDREHQQQNQCTARVAKVPLHVDVKQHKEVLQAFDL